MLRGRPLAGFGLAAILFGIAYLGGQSLDANRQERIAQESQRSARYSMERARDLLQVQTETVALMAHNAVVNPRMVVALRGRVDEGTLADIFTSEPWWEPYRELGAAISYEGTEIAYRSGEGLEGIPLGDLVEIVRRENASVTRFVAGADRVFLMAAVPMRLAERSDVVLILAKPLDRQALEALMEQTKAPLLITDGKRALGSTGLPGDVRLLQGAIGRETEGRVALQDTAWGAATGTIAPGLWLWAGARVTAFARAEAAKDVAKKRGLWAAALLLGLLSIATSLRRRPDDDAFDQEDDEDAPPAQERGRSSSRLPSLSQTGTHPAADAPVIPPGVGTPLGRYVLLDRIGEGGMAEVYTAVSFGSGGFRRSFVVKRLRPEMTANPVAVSHFIDEANLASTLVHPNIVPVFDFGEVNGAYFLAQEYIVGRDLGRLTRRMVERNLPPISPVAALYIAHEMSRGLHYAHEKRADDGTPLDLVHRDVTPENVMITERGEVKILDFGIVKSSQRVSQTDIGMVKGNVDYMSPEQARGRSVDRRSDIFSTALTIYFALARTPLYRGETLFDRLTKAAMGPGESELALIASLPEPLPAVLGRALALDPAERYQTAEDFAQAVMPYIASGAAELSGVVNAIFGDELQLEQDRLAAAFPRAKTRETSLAEGDK